MKKRPSTDYATYREIMDELLRPIDGRGLDVGTLKRLYESKLVYLENLRVKCFREINGNQDSPFTLNDYELILGAVQQTGRHLRELILMAIMHNLERRKIS